MKKPESIEADNEKAPFLKNWSNIYTALIIIQLILVLFFIYLTFKYNQ